MVIFRLEIVCLVQRSSFALSTTIHSRNEPMAKPLTSWLVPSFLQHNLRLVVSECWLPVSVTKFWHKFCKFTASKISTEFHDILCVFVNFAEFRGSATARNIRSPVIGKKKLCMCSRLFCTFLCRCFALLQRETSRNFLVKHFMEEMLYVYLFTFFFAATHFNLGGC